MKSSFRYHNVELSAVGKGEQSVNLQPCLIKKLHNLVSPNTLCVDKLWAHS